MNRKRKPLSGKASNFRELRMRMRMDALRGSELEEYYVNTQSGRDKHFNLGEILINRLEETKESYEDAKVLVYGHGGCGKSTELNKLYDKLSAEFVVVSYSIMDSGNPLNALSAEEIILTLMEQVMKHVKQSEDISVNETHLSPLKEFFSKETFTGVTTSKTEGKASAEIQSGTGIALGPFLKMIAKLNASIQLSADKRTTVVQELKKQTSDLIALTKVFINTINEALPDKKEILIIVEDLDKIDISYAKDLFIDKGNVLKAIPTHMILTVPIHLIHSSERGHLERLFGRTIGLPMIKTMDLDLRQNNHAPEGFQHIRDIVLKRMEKDLIEEDALTLLIEKTGGVLQHVFRALNDASQISGVEPPLTTEHIKIALNKKKAEFWEEIIPPSDMLEKISNEQLYEQLSSMAKNQQKGKRNTPESNPINQILLKCCAVIQYNGTGALGVHPLVIENLKDRGDIPQK